MKKEYQQSTNDKKIILYKLHRKKTDFTEEEDLTYRTANF